MTTLYLIRHGQKIQESGDPGLTELGKAEAQKTGAYLADKQIARIYTSTFKRARETAAIIDKTLQVGIDFDPRLKERRNWGEIPGESFTEFITEWEYSNTHRDYDPQGVGFSSHQAGENICKVVEELVLKWPKSNIVVVAHGGIICDFLRDIFPENKLREFILNFPEELDRLVKECSVTIVTKDENGYSLKALASTAHLI